MTATASLALPSAVSVSVRTQSQRSHALASFGRIWPQSGHAMVSAVTGGSKVGASVYSTVLSWLKSQRRLTVRRSRISSSLSRSVVFSARAILRAPIQNPARGRPFPNRFLRGRASAHSRNRRLAERVERPPGGELRRGDENGRGGGCLHADDRERDRAWRELAHRPSRALLARAATHQRRAAADVRTNFPKRSRHLQRPSPARSPFRSWEQRPACRLVRLRKHRAVL